jgi:diguanylate cyclase (GGDEF)-like protein
MLDADHFKNVNDCYGHAAGDAVLKNVTAVISRNLRGFDVLARYGGEEFLIIAPNCNLEEAHSMTQRILQKLEEAPINVGQSVIHVTMSAGVTCGAAPTIAEDLIDASDGALYRAKARGRNRVEIEEVRGMHSGRKLLIVPSGSV